MRKLIGLLLTFALSLTTAYAESISKKLTSLGLNKSAISVSIRDTKTGNVVYSLNSKTPMLPASTLKLVTASASIDTLGNDFIYSTKLYKSTNNDLYLKLSGDPLLNSKDLEQLIETAKNKDIVPKTFYIDDTVFDSVEWGEGWQWDDEFNPLMQKFSAYNVNKNLVKIVVTPKGKNVPANIIVKPFYPWTFINMVVGNVPQTRLSVEKNDSIAPNVLSISGVVSEENTLTLPVTSPKMNFILRLEDAIKSKKFEYYSSIKTSTLPSQNIYLVEEVQHNVGDILPSIIKNSSNFMAETLFKTAGAVWANSQGNHENSMGMLKQYLTKIDILTDDVEIVDGSGVSKNNLMTSDFMTKFLTYKANEEDFEDFKSLLPTPGEGTLKNRMLYFRDNLRAKTGTLSNTSAIAGYITSQKGKSYAFDIMINDAKTSSADKKNIEEQILRTVFVNY